MKKATWLLSAMLIGSSFVVASPSSARVIPRLPSDRPSRLGFSPSARADSPPKGKAISCRIETINADPRPLFGRR